MHSRANESSSLTQNAWWANLVAQIAQVRGVTGTSVRDWARRLPEYARTGGLRQEMNYWLSGTARAIPLDAS